MGKIPTNWYRNTVLPIVVYKSGKPYVICREYNERHPAKPTDLEVPLADLSAAVREAEKNCVDSIRCVGRPDTLPAADPLRQRLREVRRAKRTVDDMLASLKPDGNNELLRQ